MERGSRAKAKSADLRLRARRRTIRIFAGVAAGFLLLWCVMYMTDRTTGVAPEKVVSVYFTHHCKCVGQWKNSLEAQGFTVLMFEPENLSDIRSELHTPDPLHGCHVAKYLGYFLEGHIAPSVLDRIAQSRPQGEGFVTEVTLTSRSSQVAMADEESSPVILLGKNGERTVFAGPIEKPVDTEKQ